MEIENTAVESVQLLIAELLKEKPNRDRVTQLFAQLDLPFYPDQVKQLQVALAAVEQLSAAKSLKSEGIL